ncbi:uncharacterized protein TM35_000102970 [Trypanosoma theileri]|uniref:Titin n=1 Tax=Trypanosoma theileri TaxID=67003 RepID=A0A1X0P0J8_9TRYP|nr:uncharacterized protein TM35_000102970 [Trypanosoma theileri]ORC90029.1 hypothetical protein TM35_000102970 [Trypanosoma theileri]
MMLLRRLLYLTALFLSVACVCVAAGETGAEEDLSTVDGGCRASGKEGLKCQNKTGVAAAASTDCAQPPGKEKCPAEDLDRKADCREDSETCPQSAPKDPKGADTLEEQTVVRPGEGEAALGTGGTGVGGSGVGEKVSTGTLPSPPSPQKEQPQGDGQSQVPGVQQQSSIASSISQTETRQNSDSHVETIDTKASHQPNDHVDTTHNEENEGRQNTTTDESHGTSSSQLSEATPTTIRSSTEPTSESVPNRENGDATNAVTPTKDSQLNNGTAETKPGEDESTKETDTTTDEQSNSTTTTTTTTTLPPEPINNKKGDADSSSSISSSVWVRVPLLIVVTLACILVC